MGNASIPLGRRNWVFFAQQLVLWGQSSGCIHRFLHWKGKEVISGRYFKYQMCRNSFFLPSSTCISYYLSDLPLASEASVSWGQSPSHSTWVVCFINYFQGLSLLFFSVKYIYSVFGLIAFGMDSEWYMTQQDGCITGHLYKEFIFVSLVPQPMLRSCSKPTVAFGCFFQNVFMHTISDILLVRKEKWKSEIATDKSPEEHSVWNLTFL